MATRYDLEILIRTKKEGDGIKETDKAVSGLGDKLKGFTSTLTGVTAGLTAVGVTFKQAFELAEEGAQLNQLEESFTRLNTEVLHTPGLLEDMSAAARDTIKEVDLMAGVLTLTAGQTDEMAQQFAGAAPRLVEIAKAANKLNPSLGDTAFLYESIATGIKRSSPLILDNLGIVVKVGEANEAYAEQLGKTVEELTAQEKQMALLNATMEAGDQLIAQVGGNVDSQQDAWLEFRGNIGETTDALKRHLADGLLPWIQLVNGDYHDAIRQIEQDNIAAAEATGDYTQAKYRTLEAEQEIIASAAKTSSSVEEFTQKLIDAQVHIFDERTTRAWYDQEKAARAATGAQEQLAEQMGRTAVIQENELNRATENYTTMTAEARQEAIRFKESLDDQAAVIQNTMSLAERTALINERLALAEGRAADEAARLADRQREVAEVVNQYAIDALQGVNDRLLDFNVYSQDWKLNAEGLNQIAFDAIIANGGSAEALTKLKVARGELTQEEARALILEAQLVGQAEELGRQFANGEISVKDYQTALEELVNGSPYAAIAEVDTGNALERLRALAGELDKLDGRHTRSTHTQTFETKGDSGGGKGGSKAAADDYDPNAKFAMGGSMIVPPGYNNDDYLIGVSSGERVNVTPAGGRSGGNQIVNNIYGVASPESVATAINNSLLQLGVLA